MIYFARWKIILVLVISLLSFVYSAPNFLSENTLKKWQETLPAWMPVKTVNLGLDLQGGSHLLLEADIESVIKQKTDDLLSGIRAELRDQKIEFSNAQTIENGAQVTLVSLTSIEQAEKIMRRADENLLLSMDGLTLSVVYDEKGLKAIQDQTMSQSVEIVSRRVNETGTREPVIQRQGDNRILVQLPGVDNPERVKQLLGRTAKLTFHLVDVDGGSSSLSRTLPMKPEMAADGTKMPAQSISIQRRIIMSGDVLTKAQPAFQEGMPIVSFALNAKGARDFCDVTTKNVDKPFAVVLDNEVITAPRINEPICGGAAVISGSFTVQETNDLALLLRAGALPTSLTVVEERSVGPSLGSDSVEAGKVATMIAFALIIGFMMLTYRLFGVFASCALLVNVAMIFALLSVIGVTLTLPGIAGIVLTMGMAVDANVLIFERMREEQRAGRSIISSIDTGYQKAMASIIDSNLTTLIAGIILFAIGTGPIKGFAVTLSIGIVTSMFSAIMLTRLMVVMWLKKNKPQALPI